MKVRQLVCPSSNSIINVDFDKLNAVILNSKKDQITLAVGGNELFYTDDDIQNVISTYQSILHIWKGDGYEKESKNEDV